MADPPALAERLAAYRAELAERVQADPTCGREHAAFISGYTDALVRTAFAAACAAYPNPNPSSSERVSLVALGGYGRGEMAPYSDIDLMFLTPQPRAPWCEQVIESTLYALWDAKLKVGQSIRSISELLSLARTDMTVRTAMLESRLVGGDPGLFEKRAPLSPCFAICARRYRNPHTHAGSPSCHPCPLLNPSRRVRYVCFETAA
jgi:[protein-PII] uridylyltransferase